MTCRTKISSSQSSTSSDRASPNSVHLKFFDGFSKFDYDDTETVISEFHRLGRSRGWKKGSKTWRRNWKLCMSEMYDSVIGDHINDLETWRQLCRKLDIQGELNSITKCKKALAKVYVNIVDLLECWATDMPPKLFKSSSALANYTKEASMFFARDLAKQDKLLRVLLRHLL
ncbi:hypothetical protein N7456_013380 [Penicillium angulare]|uniref:Uncharacterized protein n=1 Tax=Penicillium angulare TaxID=116970 RepID=A0A9W9EG66_9EURO|nr:hypothetical protein N7456_013380 [Penicillium angulare]